MKTLVLCRHAKSDWPQGTSDFERPLKPRGVKDAAYLGEILDEQDINPGLIISSPARRARNTAEIIAKCIGYKHDIRLELSIYDLGAEALMELIRSLPDVNDTVMIFGHNPTMEQTVQRLIGSRAPFSLPTCAMVGLEIPDTAWARMEPGKVSLRWLLIPRLVRTDE
ncbi:MAG: histidine phosphatase family protein [Bacteroidia bacterium]|nr:histidine phosphatase family protein [Bacteroidia bacterium]